MLDNDEKLRGRRAIAPERRRASRSATSWRCARPRRISSTASTAAPAPSRRCSRAATIAAPSASSPTPAAPAARCRSARSSRRRARLVDGGLSRDRADRRRPDRLWRRSAGQPEPRPAVRRLLALVPELQRLRLSSLDPAEIDERLWRLLAEEPRLMPHLHLSLQAGDDLILKRMKRRHSRADAIAACAARPRAAPRHRARRRSDRRLPDRRPRRCSRAASLSSRNAASTFCTSFPISPRPGTPAARMPQLAGRVVKERAARLRAAGAARAARARSAARIGTTAHVLIERPRRARLRPSASITRRCASRGSGAPSRQRSCRRASPKPRGDALFGEASALHERRAAAAGFGRLKAGLHAARRSG